MKICWDNLEKMVYRPKINMWKKNGYYYVYKNSCKNCGEPYLAENGCLKRDGGLFCSVKCSKKGKNAPWYGKKHTEESKRKMSERRIGIIFTEEHKRNIGRAQKGKKLSKNTKKKISESTKGKNAPWYGKNGKDSPTWKGGVKKLGIPLYDTYAPQIEWCEEVRRNPNNSNIFQVKCTYNKCRKWFNPTVYMVRNRIDSLNGKKSGERRFYCSDECKGKCSIYGKTPEQLMKADAVMAGRDPWQKLSREIQSELKQMVHERDEWTCIKCGYTDNLHCHHLEGIRWNPLMSADIDNCVTVCSNCHKEIHSQEGCTYEDHKCKT